MHLQIIFQSVVAESIKWHDQPWLKNLAMHELLKKE